MEPDWNGVRAPVQGGEVHPGRLRMHPPKGTREPSNCALGPAQSGAFLRYRPPPLEHGCDHVRPKDGPPDPGPGGGGGGGGEGGGGVVWLGAVVRRRPQLLTEAPPRRWEHPPPPPPAPLFPRAQAPGGPPPPAPSPPATPVVLGREGEERFVGGAMSRCVLSVECSVFLALLIFFNPIRFHGPRGTDRGAPRGVAVCGPDAADGLPRTMRPGGGWTRGRKGASIAGSPPVATPGARSPADPRWLGG